MMPSACNLEVLEQHLVADIPYSPTQFAVATGSMRQMEQDQRFPFAAEHKQSGLQAAGQNTILHVSHSFLATYQKVHTGRNKCKPIGAQRCSLNEDSYGQA
jgi:hypothetical protein